MSDATAIANAKAALASINDLASLRAFVNGFDASAEAGKTAILYTGKIGELNREIKAWQVVNSLKETYAGKLTEINDTARGQVMQLDEFQDALKRAVGVDNFEAYRDLSLAPDGQLGFWAKASDEFAASIHGNVIGITLNGEVSSVFNAVELKRILTDPASGVTSINGIGVADLKAYYNTAKLTLSSDLAYAETGKLIGLKFIDDSSRGNITIKVTGPQTVQADVHGDYFVRAGSPDIIANEVPRSGAPIGSIIDIPETANWVTTVKAGRYINALKTAGKYAGPALGIIGAAVTADDVYNKARAGDYTGATALASGFFAGWALGVAAGEAMAVTLSPLIVTGPVGATLVALASVATGVVVGVAGDYATQWLVNETASKYKQLDRIYGDNVYGAGAGTGYTFSTVPLPTNGDGSWNLDINQTGDIIVIGHKRVGGQIDTSQAQFFQEIFSKNSVSGIFVAENMNAITHAIRQRTGSANSLSGPPVGNLVEAIRASKIKNQTVILVEKDGQLQAGVLEEGQDFDPKHGRLRGSFDVGDSNAVVTFESPDKKSRITSDGNISVLDQEGKPLKISSKDNRSGLEFDQAGSIIGSILGNAIGGRNKLTSTVASATLATLGDSFGKIIRIKLSASGDENGTRINQVFKHLDDEFLANLKSAGIGAVSSFLTAELVNAIGLNGFAGQISNTAAGAAIGQIATNLADLANHITTFTETVNGSPVVKNLDAFSRINPTMILTAVGSFLGTKLASELVSFGTVGGQIGAAVGSSLGVVVALETLKLGAIIGGPVGALVGAAIGAFVGFIVGGLIGSVFGGTPRSGADAQWDAAQGKFVVANVYARKGGSRDAARSVASAVSETFNSVLSATGGTLLNPNAVQAGNYGMRKKDFVYRPYSTQSSDAITQRFSGKDAAARLIGYGVVQGLTDPDFKIAGGDVYVKRALYNSFAMGGVDALNFDTNVLLGNISSAQSYESYLANASVINALVSAEPDSVFAIETLLNLVRADELGLTRRAASDWFGGFSFLLQEAQANAANDNEAAPEAQAA